MNNDFPLYPPPLFGLTGALYLHIRSLIGWVLSFFGVYEIQHLISSSKSTRIVELEEELLYRQYPVDIVNNSTKKILDCINGEYDEKDEEKLEEMVQTLKDYTNLYNTVNNLRKIKPDRNEEDHRLKLKKLFENIIDIEIQVGPTKEEDRITDKNERPDWTSIGFQGLDPITDFRGGGLLSLEQLCFFTTQNREIIDKINERANHPTTGYGLAITGINITVMLVDALQSGQLKNYFYQNKIEIEQFHQIFSKAFLLFDHYWVEENPEDIMKFSQIFDLFKAKLLDNLKSGIISNL